MKDYRVYGDYGLESEQLLEDFHLASEAIDWARRYCRRDLGGYSEVSTLEFTGSGEVHTLWRSPAAE